MSAGTPSATPPSSYGTTPGNDTNSTIVIGEQSPEDTPRQPPSKPKKRKNRSCKDFIIPGVVSVMMVGLVVVVYVMVHRLLTENRPASFEPNPPHPVDDLAQMRTIGPGLRWPVVLLLTTVLVLSVGVAGLVWALSRQPALPSTNSVPPRRRPHQATPSAPPASKVAAKSASTSPSPLPPPPGTRDLRDEGIFSLSI